MNLSVEARTVTWYAGGSHHSPGHTSVRRNGETHNRCGKCEAWPNVVTHVRPVFLFGLL